MTKDVTTSLRELVEKATPLPWAQVGRLPRIGREHDGHPFGSVEIANFGDWDDEEIRPYNKDRWLADTALTIASVNALPGLLDENDELRARALSAEGEVERLKAALSNIGDEAEECSFIAAALEPNERAIVTLGQRFQRIQRSARAARLSIGKGNGEGIPGSSSTAASSSISSDFGQVKS